MSNKAQQEEMMQIFFRYNRARMQDAKERNTRFVHYTTAAAALNIIKNREIWLREASCMNDFSEVRHGLNCLKWAYRSQSGGLKFQTVLNKIAPGITDLIEREFDLLWERITQGTYIACFSEHDSSEDDFGRLSMWRAYGPNNGVALILNNAAFFSEQNAFNAFTSPVAYLNNSEFDDELARIAARIEENVEKLKALGMQTIKDWVLFAFHFAVLSTKHKGFKEEREWRVLISPGVIAPMRLKYETEVLDGLPQCIYKLPLKEFPEVGNKGIVIPDLLNGLIIGPSEYPKVLRDAFIQALAGAGVENPSGLIRHSEVPLRRR